jgi:hypothetical protein
MKYLALLLLLSGCAAPLSREANPAPEPISVVPEPMPTVTSPYTPENMPGVVGGSNVEDMPSFPVPIERIRATNALRAPYKDFLPQDATNGSNAYQNGSRAKEVFWLAHARINTNEVNRQAIIADRVMLHHLYVQATNGDEHAKMNYHRLRTNEVFMSRLTNSASESHQ